MDTPKMLHQMCHNTLSNADIRAIAKNRGFSTQEASSVALFENFYLSETGIPAMMEALSPSERAALHLLHTLDDLVDIVIFERVYRTGDRRRYYGGSFNQRYQPILKEVKANLVRKGILLMAEVKNSRAKSKMERWRFRLPEAFAPFLPPIIAETTTFDDDGDLRSEVLRNKILSLTGAAHQQKSASLADASGYDLRLLEGSLYIGEYPFQVTHLQAWQNASWDAARPGPRIADLIALQRGSITIVGAINTIMGKLPNNGWIRPDQLEVPLKIFTRIPGDIDYNELCLLGWYQGCLARQKVGDQVYYRLPRNDANASEILDSLEPNGAKTLRVHLKTVPYHILEQLASIADFTIEGPDRPTLLAYPNLIKLGRIWPGIRDESIISWLRDHAPSFQPALRTIEKRWGRQILHENLLVAKIGDLGLKVQLERTFANTPSVVFLTDDHITFPRTMLSKVEKAVAKTGHVIKRVEAS